MWGVLVECSYLPSLALVFGWKYGFFLKNVFKNNFFKQYVVPKNERIPTYLTCMVGARTNAAAAGFDSSMKFIAGAAEAVLEKSLRVCCLVICIVGKCEKGLSGWDDCRLCWSTVV